MRAETNSVSSDDEAEIEEEEDGDEKESEGDGDDEAEDVDERRDMMMKIPGVPARPGARDNRLGVGYPLSDRSEMDSQEDLGIPTFRVTVTVEEADEEEEISNKDDNLQGFLALSASSDPDTDTAKLDSDAGDTNESPNEPAKIKPSTEEESSVSQKEKLPLTAVDSGFKDNSPSAENSESFTVDNSADDGTTPTEDTRCGGGGGSGNSVTTAESGKVGRKLGRSDWSDVEIVLDSDVLVEIDECFDGVSNEDHTNSDTVTEPEANANIDRVNPQIEQKVNPVNFGCVGNKNAEEEAAVLQVSDICKLNEN